ncbi:MAG TPA: uracil-DNA glycosylase family protein [Tianweitania sediminis]|nr:uracil-DNA glycosylase family protein [Tianweitania sediminis]
MPIGGTLPHEPRPIFVVSRRARILIASQAPGVRAHQSGIPFQDPSGIRQWLGVDEDVFYNPANFAILPMGFCFPGHDRQKGDLPPRGECAPAWQRQALDLMPQIELILLVGSHSQRFHLGANRAMATTVGDWRQILASSNKPNVLPLPHPSWRNSSWLKRNPWFEDELLPVLQQRVRLLLQSTGAAS